MIEGLKLTMTGVELSRRLDERIKWHRDRALHFERALSAPDTAVGAIALLPVHILEHMRDQHETRAGVLTLIHGHLVAGETYRLGEHDLIFAELIPGQNDD